MAVQSPGRGRTGAPIRATTRNLSWRNRLRCARGSFTCVHAPWPFVCLGLPARRGLATCHPGRSGSIPHKRPGERSWHTAYEETTVPSGRNAAVDLYFLHPRKMENFCIIDEVFSGCVRFRLYGYRTDTGADLHGIELIAFNAWIGEPKLLSFHAGLHSDPARLLFDAMVESILDYDWMEGDFVVSK
jgi:hypothetical protein